MLAARFKPTMGRALLLSAAGVLALLPQQSARAWGRNADKLVVNKAVDTLPPDVRDFFAAIRDVLAQHVTDPLDSIAKTPQKNTTTSSTLISMGASRSTRCRVVTKQQ